MLTRNEYPRRRLTLRLLSMLPTAFALASLIASGTALADGPLDAVSTVQQPVASVTEPVTEAVQTVTAPASEEPVAEPAPSVTEPVTEAVTTTDSSTAVTAAAEPVVETTEPLVQATEPVSYSHQTLPTTA
jgi:hypothetical protein